MEKTKILKPVLILTGVFAIFVIIFAYAYHIQETVGEGHIPYFLVSVAFIGLFIVLLIKYSPLFMQREAEGKIEKAYKRDEKNLIKKVMTLNLDDLGYLFKDEMTYKKVTDKIFWAFKRSIWTKSTSYIIQVLDNYDLEITEEEAENEDQNDFTNEEIKALDEAIPRKYKTNNNTICRVVFNAVDNVNEKLLKTGEVGIINYRVLSETAGAFAPAILYFIYDKSTNTLYYERPYKKGFINPRKISMNRLYKVLGLIEE